MHVAYRAWLESQKYSPNTIATQTSQLNRLEAAYGDLNELYVSGGLDDLIGALSYSSEDQRRGKQNPSKLAITGDLRTNLASYKSSVALYKRFLVEAPEGSEREEKPNTPLVPEPEKQRLSLERDLQLALRRRVEQLEAGLTIIDGGAERAVDSGLIGITARDRDGNVVVIELKAGVAGRNAVGQVLSYMRDVSDEEAPTAVRGLLVAESFDSKARSAARIVPSLSLKTYSISFTVSDVE